MSVRLDDSLEDERDLDQIMENRRAAEIELDTMEGVASREKLPHHLNGQGRLGFLFFFCFISIPSPSPMLLCASSDARLPSPCYGDNTPMGRSDSPWENFAPSPIPIRAILRV
ncbi:unnamed protein product [Lactuca virosa]|uniref:Uncharacterized protein n=1 Tax=Lactuca virosa TaxID=75947 RepID=A0AAU9LA18_9ASTR|nr:unnamed protein product [Lactuca virosa]